MNNATVMAYDALPTEWTTAERAPDAGNVDFQRERMRRHFVRGDREATRTRFATRLPLIQQLSNPEVQAQIARLTEEVAAWWSVAEVATRSIARSARAARLASGQRPFMG